jgi:hypothetical protein
LNKTKTILKILFIIVSFIFSQPTEDIIYLNDGKVIKGKIVSGGNSGDYYIQIKTEGQYQNYYMVDVRDIKRNQVAKTDLPKIKTSTIPKTSSKIKSLPEKKEADNKRGTTQSSSSISQTQRKTEEKKKDRMGVIFGASWGFPGKYNLDTKIRLGEWSFGYSMGGFESLYAYEFTVGRNFGKITTNILKGTQHFSGNKYPTYDYMGGSIYYKINSFMDIDVGLISGNEEIYEGLQLYLKSGINYEF